MCRWPSRQLEVAAARVAPEQEPARVRGREDVEIAVVVHVSDDEAVDEFSQVQQARTRPIDEANRDQRPAALGLQRDGMDAPLVARMRCGNAGDGNREQDEECCREKPAGDHLQTIARLRRAGQSGGRRSGVGGRESAADNADSRVARNFSCAVAQKPTAEIRKPNSVRLHTG